MYLFALYLYHSAILSDSKDITAFSFLAVDNAALSADVVATITGTDITATVPIDDEVVERARMHVECCDQISSHCSDIRRLLQGVQCNEHAWDLLDELVMVMAGSVERIK